MSIFYKHEINKQRFIDSYYKTTNNDWHHIKNYYVKTDANWKPAYTYFWEPSAWSTCSKSCGGGIQTRTIRCKRNDGIYRDDRFCDGIIKPALSQSCNTQSCYSFANWVAFDFADGGYRDVTYGYNSVIANTLADKIYDNDTVTSAMFPVRSLNTYSSCSILSSSGIQKYSPYIIQPIAIAGNYRIFSRFALTADRTGGHGSCSFYFYNGFSGSYMWSIHSDSLPYHFEIDDCGWNANDKKNHTKGGSGGWYTLDLGVYQLSEGTASLPGIYRFIGDAKSRVYQVFSIHYCAIRVE